MSLDRGGEVHRSSPHQGGVDLDHDPARVLAQPDTAQVVKLGQGRVQRGFFPNRGGAIAGDVALGDSGHAFFPAGIDQPGVQAGSVAGFLGHGDFAEEAPGLAQVPRGDAGGAAQGFLGDGAARSLLEDVEQGRDPRRVVGGLGGHVAHVVEFAALALAQFDGVVEVDPGPLGS